MKRAKHKTVPKELKLLINRLERKPFVSKVVLGLVESCRHRYTPGTAKVLGETDAGVRLKGYFGSGVISIFIVTEDKDAVKDIVEDR